MPIPQYKNTGPVDCTVKPDLSQVKGKSVIVTGGANGLGEGYVRTFAAAGAYVTLGDIDEERSKRIVAEVGKNVQFVKCDTSSWEDQIRMFKEAKANSPNKSIDIVIANAGIGGVDPIYKLDDPNEEPVKPVLKIIDVDLIGVLYTFKLAVHYFRGQREDPGRDRCMIFKGSMAGILDTLGAWQYSTAKWGIRGLMRSVRRISWQEGIRVNYVAPYYVKSQIRNLQTQERLESRGVEFAWPEDCTAAMLRIACDRSINGRSLAIVPRSGAVSGFMDAEMDDFDEDHYFRKLQDVVYHAFGGETTKWVNTSGP